jgi:hypothetical protein
MVERAEEWERAQDKRIKKKKRKERKKGIVRCRRKGEWVHGMELRTAKSREM